MNYFMMELQLMFMETLMLMDQSWDYADGWAYRKNDASPTTSFDASGWNISGTNVSDGFGKNELSDKPFYNHIFKQDLMILGMNGNTDPDTVANAPKTDFKISC